MIILSKICYNYFLIYKNKKLLRQIDEKTGLPAFTV